MEEKYEETSSQGLRDCQHKLYTNPVFRLME
jgi:hypothetical protein